MIAAEPSQEPSPDSIWANAFKVLTTQILKHKHQYEIWQPGEKIELRQFQQEVADEAKELFRKKKEPVVALEVFCAGGKTIVGGFIALSYLKDPNKVVIFISPKRDAFPHFKEDLRRVLHTFGMDPNMIYSRDNTDMPVFPVDKRIFIVTPYDIVNPYASAGERKVINETLKRVGLAIVDEAHRMPGDAENDTAIIGKIEPIIRGCAMPYGAHVLTMTGTHWRSADGKHPFGIRTPDIRRTCQQLIMAKVLPVLYGFAIPIEIEIQPGETRRYGGEIHLAFARRKMTQYLNKVADAMMETIRIEQAFAKSVGAKKPGGHAIFVSRQKQAVEICDILNERMGRGQDDPAFVPYVSDEIEPRLRNKIIEKLKDGRLMGYATVMLGVESLNIPRLKYGHLVARVVSENKLMQGPLGRIMRLPDTDDCKLVKDKAIIVDYQVMKDKIIELAMGLRAIQELGGSEIEQEKVGGPLFRSPTPGPAITGISLGEYNAWITRKSGTYTPHEELRAAIAEMKKKGQVLYSRKEYRIWAGNGRDYNAVLKHRKERK